jgi:hypothetical protein
MKNKKMIVNYCQCWGESGTHYTQQIKIDVNTMLLFNKYLEKLKKEVEKDFKIKRVCTEEDLNIKYLEPLKVGVNYTNLIHLRYFTSFYLHNIYIPPKKDKDFERILNRNTVIIVK